MLQDRPNFPHLPSPQIDMKLDLQLAPTRTAVQDGSLNCTASVSWLFFLEGFLCSVLTPHSRPPPPSAWSLTAQCNHYSYTLAALPYNQGWGQSRDLALQCGSTFKQAEFQVDNCMWLANDVINVQMAFGRTKLPHPSLGP